MRDGEKSAPAPYRCSLSLSFSRSRPGGPALASSLVPPYESPSAPVTAIPIGRIRDLVVIPAEKGSAGRCESAGCRTAEIRALAAVTRGRRHARQRGVRWPPCAEWQVHRRRRVVSTIRSVTRIAAIIDHGGGW